MKRSILFLILMSFFSPLAAQYSVSGGSGTPLRAENNTQNRLEVYLLNGLSGTQIRFTSTNSVTHQWYRYKENANDATPVASFQTSNSSSYITDVQDGYGYFVGSPTDPLTHYVWIIDYSKYVPLFIDLEVSEEDDKCTFLKILADVEAEPLVYYLPSGMNRTLDRIYHLEYDTQVWEGDSRQFIPKKENVELRNWISEIQIPAPLANTYFTLTGDQFTEYFWGTPKAIRSKEYRAIAIEAHGIAETTKEHAINEMHLTGEALGGSAPIEYTFTAYANEPVARFYIWKISEQDSETLEMRTIVRYTADRILQYNFERDGFYRVELEVFGDQSICFDTIPPIDVMINSTVVKIPNAFSPGSSLGVNDELRIAFTSVLSFRASVYNRWGNLLFQWNDPAKGWDGRVNGMFVPTGVYTVVVEYKDSSGKLRTASKSVNVLRAKN